MTVDEMIAVADRIRRARPKVLIALEDYERISVLLDEHFPGIDYGWDEAVKPGQVLVIRQPANLMTRMDMPPPPSPTLSSIMLSTILERTPLAQGMFDVVTGGA